MKSRLKNTTKIEKAIVYLNNIYQDFQAFYFESFNLEQELGKKFFIFRFFILYNSCFECFLETKIQIFLQENQFSLDFKKFKQNFIIKNSRDIIEISAKLQKSKDCVGSLERSIINTLFGFWVVSSQQAILKDFFDINEIANAKQPLFFSNSNLFLTLQIEFLCDSTKSLINELSFLEKENNCLTKENSLNSLVFSFSKIIDCLIELVIFRTFLVTNVPKLKQFSFSQINYIQLVLLFDVELFMLLESIEEFLKMFSQIYQKNNNGE